MILALNQDKVIDCFYGHYLSYCILKTKRKKPAQAQELFLGFTIKPSIYLR